MATITGTQLALMYALAGVGRSGAMRANYVSSAGFVAIGGVQYATGRLVESAQIVDGSLSISDVLNDTPNTCAMTVRGFVPTVGQTVVVTLGSMNNGDRRFTGSILNLTQTYTDGPLNQTFALNCIDQTWGLDRRTVTARYQNQSATTIAQDLVARYAPGYTTRRVVANLPVIDEITVTNGTLTGALSQLAARFGGYWDVSGTDVAMFLDDPTGTPPTPLTAAADSLTAVAVQRDLSQIVTRVLVEGGGANALAAVLPGAPFLPVVDSSWYPPAGGSVVCGPQRLAYTAVMPGGAGSLVGPGASGPPTAPTLGLLAGTGLGSGTYRYAYTDVTASGETPASPLGTIVAGALLPPPAPAVFEASGTGIPVGNHDYAVTYTTAAGETTPGPIVSRITAASTPISNPPSWNAFNVNNSAGGSLSWNYYAYAVTFVDAAGGETTLGNSVSPWFLADNLNHALNISNFPYPWNAPFAGLRLYRIRSGATGGAAGWHLVANLPGAGPYTDGLSDALAATGPAPPTVNTAAYVAQRNLLSVPLGNASVTGRKLYRTVVGSPILKLAATIADNVTTAYVDAVSDASLGAAAPSTNTAIAAHVTLSGIAIGPAAVTGRRIYRTVVNGSQLKLQQTIANNTATVGVTDATADGSLGANAPTGDTSGLSTVTGQVLAGATSILTASAAPFQATGGVVLLPGDQFVTYSGLTGNTLTGVPASGVGAILTTVLYGSPIIAVPVLVGIPESGAGAILYPIKQGDPVNLLVTVDSLVAQAALAALVGGDGIQESYLQDRRLAYTEASARGRALLALRSAVDVVVTYTTRDQNSRSGRAIVVNLPPPMNVSATLKIQQVTVSAFTPAINPTCTVQASSTRFSFEALIRLAQQASV